MVTIQSTWSFLNFLLLQWPNILTYFSNGICSHSRHFHVSNYRRSMFARQDEGIADAAVPVIPLYILFRCPFSPLLYFVFLAAACVSSFLLHDLRVWAPTIFHAFCAARSFWYAMQHLPRTRRGSFLNGGHHYDLMPSVRPMHTTAHPHQPCLAPSGPAHSDKPPRTRTDLYPCCSADSPHYWFVPSDYILVPPEPARTIADPFPRHSTPPRASSSTDDSDLSTPLQGRGHVFFRNPLRTHLLCQLSLFLVIPLTFFTHSPLFSPTLISQSFPL
jgi:hypothetical protein